MSKPIALLADGDVFAFQAARSAEYVHNFGTTYHLMAELEEAQRHVRGNMERIAKEIKADKIINTLSCPSRNYWRHDVLPSYKGGRNDYRGPICLAALKVWMSTEYETYLWTHMEADDVMGVLATDPEFLPDHQKVIVSIDKDMKTIPETYIFNPDKDYQPWYNSKEAADRWFLSQAIGGDTTDGYPGCPNLSTESAAAFLDAPWFWETYEHTFKSGPRKGEAVTKWRKALPRDDVWENIVSLFIKAGSTVEEALVNARVARICRHSDYDQKSGEVKLWLPNQGR